MNPPRRSKADQMQIEIFRRMTPGQRLECALHWTELTLELARSGIRDAHPDWAPAEVEREVGRRITGIDVTKLDWNRVLRQQAHLKRREHSTQSPSPTGQAAPPVPR